MALEEPQMCAGELRRQIERSLEQVRFVRLIAGEEMQFGIAAKLPMGRSLELCDPLLNGRRRDAIVRKRK